MTNHAPASQPQIVIGLRAIPNRPTDGYIHVAHPTEPKPADRDAAVWLAERIIARLGSKANQIGRIEISFQRDHSPGYLNLEGQLILNLEDNTILALGFRQGSINDPRMREPEHLEGSVIEDLMQDIAHAVQQAIIAHQNHADNLAAWYKATGEPLFRGLF